MDEARKQAHPLVRGLIQLWLPLGLVALWFIGSARSRNVYWPPLSEIVESIVDGFTEGSLLSDLAFSFTNYFIGLILAFVIAVVLGLVFGEFALLRKALMPLLDFARATPHVALVPVIILALGIGAGPKIFLIAFGCVWPILLNTIDGIRMMPASILETAKAYRIPWHLRVLKVILPGALPQMVVGIRLAISIGVVMLLVSEMFGAEQGIGYFIVDSGANFAISDTWAGTIIIGVIGYLLSLAFGLLEHRMLRWHHRTLPIQRGTVAPTAAAVPSPEQAPVPAGAPVGDSNPPLSPVDASKENL